MGSPASGLEMHRVKKPWKTLNSVLKTYTPGNVSMRMIPRLSPDAKHPGRNGYTTKVTEPVALNVWAYFRQLSGKEIFAAAAYRYDEEVLFTINYRAGLTTACYVEYNGVKYSVTRIDTFEGYKQDITLYCKRM